MHPTVRFCTSEVRIDIHCGGSVIASFHLIPVIRLEEAVVVGKVRVFMCSPSSSTYTMRVVPFLPLVQWAHHGRWGMCDVMCLPQLVSSESDQELMF